MVAVRVAHAEPLPGKLPNGNVVTAGHLVVLADDAGHRAVPVWLQGGTKPGADDLARLVELRDRPPGDAGTAGSTAPAAPDWVQHEVTTRVPGDCRIIMFGVFLAGSGRIELRQPELTRGMAHDAARRHEPEGGPG